MAALTVRAMNTLTLPVFILFPLPHSSLPHASIYVLYVLSTLAIASIDASVFALAEINHLFDPLLGARS